MKKQSQLQNHQLIATTLALFRRRLATVNATHHNGNINITAIMQISHDYDHT